jgi:hypothetical protein
MNQMFNHFNGAELPHLTLCKPNKDRLYSLGLAYTIKETLKYNAQSTLEFVYPKYAENKITLASTADPAYDFIRGKMLVQIDDRFYIINSCPEDSTGATPYKTVSCLSLEAEMLAHRVLGLSGTYQFLPLLQLVLGLCPSWKVGNIDPTLLPLYRTFDTTTGGNNSTLYAFLTTEAEKAYNCVFSFDSYTKTVSAVANLVPYPSTNITVSFDNLTTKTEYKEISEEICTALSCYGGDGLDIHYVNPLGNNVIYNFDYFKNTEWMSQGLIDVLNLWETKVEANRDTYVSQLTALETLDGEMTVLLADLSDMNSQLYSLDMVKDAKSQQGLDTSAINAQIKTQKAAIASKNTDIAAKQKNIDSLRISLREIVHNLFFTAQVSYINIKDDIASITDLLTSISVNWTNVYNANSTYPGFSNTLLTTKTPVITALIVTAQNENNALYNYLAAGFSSYPPSSSIITNIKNMIHTEITTLTSLFGTFQSIIPSTAVTILLDEIITEMTSFLTIVDYTFYMNDLQYLELSQYIFENSYTNQYIIMTNTLTPAQVQTQSQGLYDCGKIILERTSVPRYEFTGEFGNLMALPEFSTFAEQLDVGKVITVVKGDDKAINAVLLTMSITYDNPNSFAMTFGNSLRLDDPTFIYTDLIGPITTIPGPTGTGLGTIPAPNPITLPPLPIWTIPTIPIPTFPVISIPGLFGANGTDKTYTWPIGSPAIGGIGGPRMPTNCYIKNVYAYIIGGTSAAFNLEIRQSPETPTTPLMTSDLTVSPGGTWGQNVFPAPLLSVGSWLWVDINNVTGAVDTLVICVAVTPIFTTTTTTTGAYPVAGSG